MRSIPAGAGEPDSTPLSLSRRGVYPRGCGGTIGRALRCRGIQGLSPRVRGNPGHKAIHVPGEGSIPAGAGAPGSSHEFAANTGVYPRGCGGTRYQAKR